MHRRNYILKKVKERIRLIDPEARVILFGSRARKDYRKDSDWDFLVLTNQRVTRELRNKISDALFEIELETKSVLTVVIHNIESWKKHDSSSIYKNISSEGIEI